MRSNTQAISIDSPADRAFAFVADPNNLPRWAIGFAKDVRRGGDLGYVVTTGQGDVPLRVATDAQLGVVDFHMADPGGADAVVRVEDTRTEGSKVLVRSSVPAGEHVRRAGEDVREGDKVLESGAVLTPAAVGMLSSLGRAFVQVTQRPRVADESAVGRVRQAIAAGQHLQGAERLQARGNRRQFL